MTIEEYFGDWCKVIDTHEADRLLKNLVTHKESLCPKLKDIFKAFTLCKLHDLKVVILAQGLYDSLYDGRPRATGIAFANSSETLESDYSPYLEVLMESVIDYTKPHERIIFDPSLEKWEKQGVLMLNSTLSCLVDNIGAHTLVWRPFIQSFLTNLSLYDTGIVYVLMGAEAIGFESCIDAEHNHIIKAKHPSWYIRNHCPMPSDLWFQINSLLIGHYGFGIEWYKEYKFLNEQEEHEEVFYAGNC